MGITNQFYLFPRHVIGLTIALTCLTNCSGKTPEKLPGQDHVVKFSETTATKSFKTATSPLDDLGLRQDEIPAPLLAALKNPYAGSPKMKCEQAKQEIAALDAVLGPDMEAENTDKPLSPLMVNADGVSLDTDAININPGKIWDAGEDFAQDAVVGFVRAQTSFLPFRSVIRQVTGANAHTKKIARAQEAGKIRRAYLKGMMYVSGRGKCLAPSIILAPAIQEARADTSH
jgi:hypothetical protein